MAFRARLARSAGNATEPKRIFGPLFDPCSIPCSGSEQVENTL
jgi:hypothetical protein